MYNSIIADFKICPEITEKCRIRSENEGDKFNDTSAYQ